MEDKVIASVDSCKVPPQVYRKLSIKEVGATKNRLRVPCSVCGHIETIDNKGIRKSRLNEAAKYTDVRASRMAQQWFTNAWGWRTKKRTVENNFAVQSRSIGRVFLTGCGRFLRHVHRITKGIMKQPWFAIGMHGDDSFNEQYFVCKLDQLPMVIRSLCAEAPEFRRMVQLACGETSHLVVPVELEAPLEGRDDPEPVFDHGSAVPIN